MVVRKGRAAAPYVTGGRPGGRCGCAGSACSSHDYLVISRTKEEPMRLSRFVASIACATLLAGCPNFDKFDHPPDSPAVSRWAAARFGGDTFFGAWSPGGNELLLAGGTGELIHSDDGRANFTVV